MDRQQERGGNAHVRVIEVGEGECSQGTHENSAWKPGGPCHQCNTPWLRNMSKIIIINVFKSTHTPTHPQDHLESSKHVHQGFVDAEGGGVQNVPPPTPRGALAPTHPFPG